MPAPYYCPRCKTLEVIEYPNSIECPNCLLTFGKRHIGIILDEEILAFGEVGAFINGFEELKDPKTAKRFFDSIMEDLEDDC